MYFFLVSYPILGAGLKYIDDAFDEQIFNKKYAAVLAVLLGILGAYTMLVDAVSATILLAVVLGVLLKGKVDNYAFVGGLVATFSIIVLAGVQLLILPLIVLTVAALLDEVGNDIIDKKNYLLSGRRWQRFVGHFFDQRWVMKVVILSLAVMNIIPFYFFLAMFLFDGAYLGVRWYGQVRQGLPRSTQAHTKQHDTIIPPTPRYSRAYVDANKIFMVPRMITQHMGSLQGDRVINVSKEKQVVVRSNG